MYDEEEKKQKVDALMDVIDRSFIFRSFESEFKPGKERSEVLLDPVYMENSKHSKVTHCLDEIVLHQHMVFL